MPTVAVMFKREEGLDEEFVHDPTISAAQGVIRFESNVARNFDI